MLVENWLNNTFLFLQDLCVYRCALACAQFPVLSAPTPPENETPPPNKQQVTQSEHWFLHSAHAEITDISSIIYRMNINHTFKAAMLLEQIWAGDIASKQKVDLSCWETILHIFWSSIYPCPIPHLCCFPCTFFATRVLWHSFIFFPPRFASYPLNQFIMHIWTACCVLMFSVLLSSLNFTSHVSNHSVEARLWYSCIYPLVLPSVNSNWLAHFLVHTHLPVA